MWNLVPNFIRTIYDNEIRYQLGFLDEVCAGDSGGHLGSFADFELLRR